MMRIIIAAILLAATLTAAHAQEGQPLTAQERAYRRSFPDWEAREARDAVIREQAAARDARRAADAIPQETWINRDCNKYGASSVPSITPGSLSPIILEKLRQKDAPKIEAARQECELRKQQQIEAKAAKEEADRQAKIEAARQETLRKEAEQKAKAAKEDAERQATIEAARQEALRKEAVQKAMDEKAERDRKDAEARVALCYGAVPIDKAQELANVAIKDVRATMDLKSPPVDQLVTDRLRSQMSQHLNAESDDTRMPGFTKLTVTKEAAAVVVACYSGVQQLMKEQMHAIEEAKRAQPAAPAPAKPPAATVSDFKADYIIARGAIGCANLDEGALSTGKATGRIFDPSDPDHCRDISVGTAVLSQKRFRNAVCVVPEGVSTPCVWVLSDELKPAQAKPSVAAGDSKLRDADLRAAAEAFRLRPQDFAVGSTAGGLSVFLSRCRSTHPELSPAAVAAIKDASAQINQRYDTHDMTRLTSDILLGEFREIGADRWCQAFKKVIEEAVR